MIERTLELPVNEGVRLRALELLDEIAAARPRLDAQGDVDAIHDLRVALRRLRSLLKAHRAHLGKKVEKLRRQLGDVAELTGPARDAEVQLEWLATLKKGLPAGGRAALAWLMERLEAQRAQGYAHARGEAAGRLDALLPRARRRLARYRADVRDEKGVTLAAALGELLGANAAALAEQLGRVAAPTDEAAAHEARILGKQLRYLLEPLADSERVGAAAATAVKDLKALQDTLGQLHDAHVLGHVAQQAIIDAAAERARQIGAAVFEGRRVRQPRDLRDGLLAIAAKIRARRDRLYRELVRRRAGVTALVADVCAIVGILGGPPPGIEIERKYLLDRLPDMPPGRAVEMEQGYLPGKQLVERLRRMRGPDGEERFRRTVKLGAGVRRIEVEEDCPPDLFAGLWPFTAGHRIAKTRHEIPDGDLTWEIDRFADRDLVLAEVELPSETTPVTPPPWLAGAIVREVTGEKAYTNEALASTPPAPRRRRRRQSSTT